MDKKSFKSEMLDLLKEGDAVPAILPKEYMEKEIVYKGRPAKIVDWNGFEVGIRWTGAVGLNQHDIDYIDIDDPYMLEVLNESGVVLKKSEGMVSTAKKKSKKNVDSSVEKEGSDFVGWELENKDGKEVFVRIASLSAEKILELFQTEKEKQADLTFDAWSDRIKLPVINKEQVKAIMAAKNIDIKKNQKEIRIFERADKQRKH